MKKCTKCKIEKPLSEYFETMAKGKLTVNARCKVCTREGWKSPNSRWSLFKTQARRDGWTVEMTQEQWLTLIQNPCYYCEGPLPEFGRGLDRIDYKMPYTLDNVLPCCSVCNEMRGRVYSVYEQQILGKAVAEIRKFRESMGLPPPGKRHYGGSTEGETQVEKRKRIAKEAVENN